MTKLIALACLALASSGCAFYTGAFDDTPGEAVEHAYARNSAVAVPTLVGNVAGGLPGTLIMLPLILAHEHSGVAEAVVVGLVYVPAVAVGAITGLPFLPLALALPEDEWRLNLFAYGP